MTENTLSWYQLSRDNFFSHLPLCPSRSLPPSSSFFYILSSRRSPPCPTPRHLSIQPLPSPTSRTMFPPHLKRTFNMERGRSCSRSMLDLTDSFIILSRMRSMPRKKPWTMSCGLPSTPRSLIRYLPRYPTTS